MIANKHSKNLTRVSFLVLFTITLSLAFHAQLPEASAAAGDITAVKLVGDDNSYAIDQSGTAQITIQGTGGITTSGTGSTLTVDGSGISGAAAPHYHLIDYS